MYCSKCGSKVPDDAVFCFSCGAQLIKGEEHRKDEERNVTEKEIVEKKIGEVCSSLEFRLYGTKILYALLVVGCWVLSKQEMFNFWGIEKLSIGNLMNHVFNILELSGEDPFYAYLCYWLYYIGFFAYFAAIVLAFLRKEEKAVICCVIGFVCNLPIILYVLKGIWVVAEWLNRYEMDFIKVVDILGEAFWGYLVLNIVVVFCGVRFFSNVRLAREYEGKEYSLINVREKSSVKTLKHDEWRCAECGKINPSYVYVCSCGTEVNSKGPKREPETIDIDNFQL